MYEILNPAPVKDKVFIGIKLKDGRWTVNGNSFAQMTPGERRILDEFFKAYNDNLILEENEHTNN